MTDFAGCSFSYKAPSGGGSRWYAPLSGAPATLPVASGSDALAAGNKSEGLGANSLGMGYWCRARNGYDVAIGAVVWSQGGVGIGYNMTDIKSLDVGIGYTNGFSGSGGYTVQIGNNNSLILGGGGTVAGTAIGYLNTTGEYAVSVGVSNYTRYLASVCLGYACIATTPNNVSVGMGARSATFGTPSAGDLQADTFNRTGTNNAGNLVYSRTSAVAFGSGVTENFAIAVPLLIRPLWIEDGKSTTFEGHIVIRRDTDGVSARWKISGLAKRTGAVITVVGFVMGAAGAPDINDAGAAGWVLTAGVVTPAGIDAVQLYCNFNSATNNLIFTVAGEVNLAFSNL